LSTVSRRPFIGAIKVIILSMHHTAEHVFRIVQAGSKPQGIGRPKVVKALQTAMQGKSCFSRGWKSRGSAIPESVRRVLKSPLDSLSVREREVLQLVVEGRTSIEIAEALAPFSQQCRNLSQQADGKTRRQERSRPRLVRRPARPYPPALVNFLDAGCDFRSITRSNQIDNRNRETPTPN
jgi:FixJ family two-component response regulator